MCRCRLVGWINRPYPTPNTPFNTKPNLEVPLESATIHTIIRDLNARVVLTQKFSNKGKDTLELNYNYRLPKRAAVFSFVVEIDGKRIISVLKEKEQAKNDYDDALASGHGAYLSEKKDDGTFSSSIGSLPPGKEVLITIEYVTELDYDGNNGVKFDLVKNDKAHDLGGGANKAFPLTITADIQMSSEIVDIQSHSHELEKTITQGNREAKVTFKDQSKNNAESVELSILVSEAYKPTVNLEQLQGSEDVTAALSFHPDLKKEESLDEVNTEFVFLVDCSGSMSGAPMKAVKETLHIFLRSLPESCYFNIIDFGTSYRSLFTQPTKYSENSLQQAVANTDQKDATLGGTNLLKPLEHILSQEPQKGYSRQIFLLTDGQVSNNSLCINEVSKNARNTRVFTFGIGKDVDVSLVRDIARESNGECELLPYGSNFEEVVMRQLIRAMKPAISNLTIKLEGLTEKEAQITPYHPPPVYSGDRVLLYMQFNPKLVKKSLNVELSGFIGSKPFTQSLSVPISESDVKKVTKENALLPYLFGYSSISDLEKSRSYLHLPDGRLNEGVKESDITKQALATSLKSGILCKETAFVAVEERDGSLVDVPVVQNISSAPQVQRPSPRTFFGGRGGRSGPVLNSAPTRKSSHSSSIGGLFKKSMKMEESKEKESKQKSGRSESSVEKLDRAAPAPRSITGKSFALSAPAPHASKPMSSSSSSPAPVNTNLPIASQLVQNQNANGSFKESALKVIGVSVDQLKSDLPTADSNESQAAFLCAIICAYFELKCQKEQTSWTLVVKKAKNWLRKEAEKLNVPMESFESAATKLVSAL